MNGTLTTGARLRFMQAGATHDADEVGVRLPDPTPVPTLGPGETGYLIAGIKDVGEARSGETVTEAARPAEKPLEGYHDPKPMVFCGLYPVDGDEFAELREALEKLRLNDASFTYEPETSGALGFGFRCGFLGLLHMEIVRERLEREFDLSLIATAPSVEYHGAHHARATCSRSTTRARCRRRRRSSTSRSRGSTVTILTPTDYTGTLMDLCQTRRGEMQKLEYLSPERVELRYRMPLAEVVTDFFDQLKSRTQGYASLDYEPDGYAGVEPREGRRAAQRRAGRRVQHDRPPRQGRLVRPQDDREAARAHPAPDVRRARSRPRSAAGSSPARR